jgi:uncharacterized membrane protein YkoI
MPMKSRTRTIIIAATVLALAVAVVGVTAAIGADDSEVPITGVEYDMATKAAIEHMGGGTVTDTEIGDEESYYEVELTMEDGRQVDVQLDRNFVVVGTEDDSGDEDED